MKNIVIESLVTSQKVAVLEDGILSELFIEDSYNTKTVSNIYRGVVRKALKGIEAYFIDIGTEKLAYLSMKNNESIKCGQDVLVQINKESIGTKGAKLNTEISFAGRYLVYIPSNDRLTISNKIKSEKERFRIKKIVQNIDKDFTGIIRTEAIGCSKEELEKDIEDLKFEHNRVLKEFKLGIGPKLLYKDLDFASKYVKDNVNDSVEKIIVNNEEKYEELKSVLNYVNKDYKNKLVLENNKDVFDLYSVQSQIDKCLGRKVWLKSGGYLIIDKTEALSVIDVNTGKFTGKKKVQETYRKINLEAAQEIGVPKDIRSVVIPLGATAHMDGAVMSNILKIAMMFAITGQPFTGIGNWASSILICVLCGVVTSAIPGAGMIGAVIIMDFFGFPTELFPIIASLTFLVDPLATMNNCTGDCSASMLVTRIVEGKDWMSKNLTKDE